MNSVEVEAKTPPDWAYKTCYRCKGHFANTSDFEVMIEQDRVYYGHTSLSACVTMLAMEVGRFKSILRNNGLGHLI